MRTGMDYLQECHGDSLYFQDVLEIVEKVVASLIHTAETVAVAYHQSEISLDDMERAVDSFPFLRRALHSGRLHTVRACKCPEAAVVTLQGGQGPPGWASPLVCVPGGDRDSECLISLASPRNFVLSPEAHAPRITRYYMVYQGVQPLQASTAGISTSSVLQQSVLAAGARPGGQDPHLQLTPEAVEASLLTDLVIRSAVMAEQREADSYMRTLSEIDVSGVAGILLQHLLSMTWLSLSAGRAEQLGALLSVVDELMKNPNLASVEHFTVMLSLLLTVVGSGSKGVTEKVRKKSIALLAKCLSIAEQFDQSVLQKVGGILINGVFSPMSQMETRVGCAQALSGVNSEEMFALVVRKMVRQRSRGQDFPSPEIRSILTEFCQKQVSAAAEAGAAVVSAGSGGSAGGLGGSDGRLEVDYSALAVCGVPMATLVEIFGEECVPVEL